MIQSRINCRGNLAETQIEQLLVGNTLTVTGVCIEECLIS